MDIETAGKWLLIAGIAGAAWVACSPGGTPSNNDQADADPDFLRQIEKREQVDRAVRIADLGADGFLYSAPGGGVTYWLDGPHQGTAPGPETMAIVMEAANNGAYMVSMNPYAIWFYSEGEGGKLLSDHALVESFPTETGFYFLARNENTKEFDLFWHDGAELYRMSRFGAE